VETSDKNRSGTQHTRHTLPARFNTFSTLSSLNCGLSLLTVAISSSILTESQPTYVTKHTKKNEEKTCFTSLGNATPKNKKNQTNPNQTTPNFSKILRIKKKKKKTRISIVRGNESKEEEGGVRREKEGSRDSATTTTTTTHDMSFE
jgi:hypothetical protein